MSTQYKTSITPDTPLYIGSYGQLLQVLQEVLTDCGVIKPETEVPMQQSELTRDMCVKVLKDKGYHVKSYNTFAELTKHIDRVKRGREFWYNAQQVHDIPKRK